MRIRSVEETTEANRVAAESARPEAIRTSSRAIPQRAIALPESRVTASLAELGRLFDARPAAAAPPEDRFIRAAALLAEATGAERVAIYLPTESKAPDSAPDLSDAVIVPARDPLAFALAASCTGRAFAAPGLFEPPASIEISDAQPSGRRLLAGQSARVVRPLAPRRPSAATRFAAVSGWSRVGSTLQVPCAGAEGLNGVVCFEGELFEPARTAIAEAARARAEAAVALVAGGLERERLVRALAVLRAEGARSERLALLGRAAGGAAHDLNNVLTAILGYADLLELELPGACVARGDDSGQRADRGQIELDEIRSAVARGAGLVEELLALGRPGAGDREAVDLAEVLERLRGLAQRVAGDAIRLELRLARGLSRVCVDREGFERTVLNLIANARHAIEAGPAGAGRIGIGLESVRDGEAGGAGMTSGRLRLSITDDGCGMTPDVARRIFEPFFTTRAANGGTGLGLAGVADFVREAGGRIRVDSSPGQGTTIHIELPPAPARPPA